MRITIALKESIFDCKIKITDSHGDRFYHASVFDEPCAITAEVFDSDFRLSLIPMAADVNEALDEMEWHSWKGKLAKKATGFLMGLVDKSLLRVGCEYLVTGVEDGDRLDVNLQSYAFGTFDRLDIFEMIPLSYSFFEVSSFNRYFKLTDAYEVNRKDVIKLAKKLAFAGGFGYGIICGIITYPLEMARIRLLSRNKRILRTLRKFNNFSNEKRQRFLEKQERFFNK